MEQILQYEVLSEELKKAENELALSEFGRELKRVRRARKLTQKRLTEITGIDDTVISDLENGNYTPSLVIIRQLSEGLNVSPYELLAPYYGIPLPGLSIKGQQALDKIRDIIAVFYHFEVQEEDHAAARQRLKIAKEEEADILAELTPDVEPVEAPPQTINHNVTDS